MVKFRENLIFAYFAIPLFRIPRFTNSPQILNQIQQLLDYVQNSKIAIL